MPFLDEAGSVWLPLDAIPTLFEDPQLRDEKPVLDANGKPVIDAFGEQALITEGMTDNLPKVHDVEKELRKVIDEFPGRVLIGETYFSNVADLRRSYGVKNDELQLPMDFQVGMINKLDVNAFRTRINEVETGVNGNEPLLVFDNHDNAAHRCALRRWRPQYGHRENARDGSLCEPRYFAVLLR